MSLSTLRVGEPALPVGSPPPIEGARLFLDGPRVRLLIAYHEPTAPEVRAAESADVEIGVFDDDGIAAVVLRVGEREGHWLIEARAPLILIDLAAHTDGVGGAPAAPLNDYPVELVLCETEHTVVLALRTLRVPAPIIRAARRAAHAQAARFPTVAAAVRAHEGGLRSRTVRDLMRLSTVRTRIVA